MRIFAAALLLALAFWTFEALWRIWPVVLIAAVVIAVALRRDRRSQRWYR